MIISRVRPAFFPSIYWQRKLPVMLLPLILILAGCATTPPLYPGEPENVVLAKLGQPAARYRVGNEQRLEYPGGPFAQRTYFAHINSEGKLTQYEQVLSTEKFATIKVDLANKDEVLRTIGHPVETSYLSLVKQEVWSYRYKEAGVWNSMMHVHFDKDGIVRRMQNGPDSAFDREPRERGGIRPW
jgi:SmpA / OmlA family